MNSSFVVNDQTEHRNFNHLVFDIAWFGLALAATTRFLSVYAIRVGATPSELAWMSSMPALILLLSSSLSGWWMSRYKTARLATVLPGFGMRFLFLLPAFTPFLPLRWQPLWLIFSVSLPAIPQGIAGVSFVTMMRETIFEKNMTSLLSRRSLALNIAVGIGALSFGFLLEQLPFPLNYQIMFFVAYAFALASLWHITRIKVVVNKPVMPPQNAMPPRQSAWRSPNFRSVAIITALTHISFTAIAAILPLFLVKRLGADEGFMALFAMMELGAGALVSLFTPRIAKRLGNRALIALAMIGTAGAALLIAFAPSLNFTLLGAALSGASWTAAASVGLMAYFMERTPAAETASYSTAFHQIIGLSMFIGPMLGSLLASSGIDLLPILVIGAAMRIGAGAVIEFSLMQGRRTVAKQQGLGVGD